MNIKHKLGEYATAIPRALYDDCPKSVFAAVAVSPAVNGGCGFAELEPAAYLVTEWALLYRQGIVSQAVPPRWRSLIRTGALDD